MISYGEIRRRCRDKDFWRTCLQPGEPLIPRSAMVIKLLNGYIIRAVAAMHQPLVHRQHSLTDD